MESPARSPDLIPIEHVWDLQEQWFLLPMELIDCIIESITHRYIYAVLLLVVIIFRIEGTFFITN